VAKVFTAEEIARLRAETPGCRNVVHFNYAGSALMPQPVIDATIDHIKLEGEIGGYEAADLAEERVEAVYDSVARLLNAKSVEIAVVENATRAWDMAFYSIPFLPGDRILTSVAEYASNVISFLQIAKRGVSVEVVPNDEHGQLSVAALKELIDDRVRLIAVSHMPTNGGLVQPAAEIGKVAKDAGILYLLDACQTAGQMPLDVDAIGCDMLSVTARKYLRGPRGVGFLYVREDKIDQLTPPMLDLHAARWVARDRYEIRGDARRFENWESSIAGKLGMGCAIDYALDLSLDRIWATLSARASSMRELLNAIPGVTVRDLGEVKGGIVTFTIDGKAPKEINATLAEKKINTTSSSIFSTRFDMENRDQTQFVRASAHYVTTDEECALLAETVEEIALTRR
jgi:cysteine desulfurase / selenocysteine lyase